MPQLQSIRHVALDLDGTVYLEAELFNETLPFLTLLDELGVGYSFLTNNASQSPADYAQVLNQIGVKASADQIHTPFPLTVAHLQTQHPGARRVYVLGTASLQGEFEQAGYRIISESPDEPEPDAVVVAMNPLMNYDQLCAAAYWLSQGKPFVATNPDWVRPIDKPTMLLGCGAICACLTRVTGREPEAVLGKPNPEMIGMVMRRNDLTADQVMMVGDRLDTDIAAATRAGAVGTLVLTGQTSRQQAAEADGDDKPSLVVENLAQLGELFSGSRAASPVHCV